MTPPPVIRVRECQACHHVSGLGEAACPACLRDDSLRERFQCSRCERVLDEPKCPVCSVRRPDPPPEPPAPPRRRSPAPRERAETPGPVPADEPVFPYETGESIPPFRRRTWPPVRRRPVPRPVGGPPVGMDLSVPVALIGGLFAIALSCVSPLGPLLGLGAFFAALAAYAKVFSGRLSPAALPFIHLGLVFSLVALGLGVLMLLANFASLTVMEPGRIR